MAPSLAPLVLTVVCLALPAAHARRQQHRAAANPVRKVVTMLQDIQQQIVDEGEKEKALFDKFMCYCKTGSGKLEQSVADANTKAASLNSALEAGAKKNEQTAQSLEKHKESREQAKKDMAKATKLREKEAAAFAEEKAYLEAHLAALGKAIPAIDKGMSGSFLQTAEASTVRSWVMEKAEMPDNQRQDVLSFLAGEADYAPASGEIVGILKTQEDAMNMHLKEAISNEEGSLKSYNDLMASKKKEVTVLNGQIEAELTRTGQLKVDIAAMSNDLEDTKQSLAQDTQFLAELGKGCDVKAKEQKVREQTRADELVALADTIKVLNDDDALELFKKALPSEATSFAQITVSAAAVRAAALQSLRASRRKQVGGRLPARPELGLIALAISGKTANFKAIISMIDEMIATLAKEQQDDDGKKQYCEAAFDKSDDQKKAQELAISDSATAIDALKGDIAALEEELAKLAAGVKALDKSVSEATEIRKAEHKEYSEVMTADENARKLLMWAKNRLNKFYDPKMYKAPPKRELSAEDRIVENFGGDVPTVAPGGIAGTGIGAAASFVQIRRHGQHRGAPPPPPEAMGAYKTKSEEKQGVVAMIDLLIRHLDKQMQEADVDEKNDQEEYEATMADAAKKRAEDSKSILDKEADRANDEEALEKETDKKEEASAELARTLAYIRTLHGECDWLLQNYGVRKEARAGEVDSLEKAKAVLSGADYSFLQLSRGGRGGHLRA